MSYVESETAETVAHMTEAAARKYVFCFRRAISPQLWPLRSHSH
jgi:hypothetical protein